MSNQDHNMSDNERHEEMQFQEVLETVRHTEPTEEQISAAARRVWEKVEAARAGSLTETGSLAGRGTETTAAGVLRTQADYEALFPAYYDNTLAQGMEELLEAKLREDVATRHAWQEYKASRGGRVVTMAQAPQAAKSARRAMPALRWVAMAAMLAMAAGLSWYGWNAWGPDQLGAQATVHAASQPLYVVRGAQVEALETGAEIMPGEQVRVPKGGSAVIALRDGSMAELREGSSFQLRSFGSDQTLHLLGGDVIVEAAKRSRGRLYVNSRDFEVAVTGTVFAVGAGAHGSRVAVVEGSVLVAQDGRHRALRPGQQYASDGRLTPVSVEKQIAWSENLDKHLALLRSLTALQAELEAVRLPSLRYSSRLAPYVPASTVIFASVPNLENAIHEAREILSSRLQQDAALREWVQRSGKEFGIEQLLAELEGMSGYLGEEVLLASVRDAQGKPGTPVLVADLRKDGFEDYMRQRIAALHPERETEDLHVYRDLDSLRAASSDRGLQIALIDGKLMLSGEPGVLREVAASLVSGNPSGFLETGLGERVAASYREGAGFFVAADVGSLIREANGSSPESEATGIENLRFLELEQRQVDGQFDLRSTVTFDGARHGITSWLAAPGPLRALEFVTPGAAAVSAAMVKDPVAMLADILPLITNKDGDDAVAELERKLNLNLREDIAAPLGNEIAFALDGPLVPVPAWKLVVQVNDPVRLGTTIERLVEAANREASLEGKGTASLTSEVIDGLRFHTLTLPEGGPAVTVHYVFAQGYLVAAPDRALLRQALQTQASGTSVLTHSAFRELIPAGASTGFSGVFFQQAGATLASMASEISRLASEDPQRAAAIEQMARELKPSMLTAYAEPQSITIASRDSLLGLGGTSALRMGFLFDQLGALKRKQ